MYLPIEITRNKFDWNLTVAGSPWWAWAPPPPAPIPAEHHPPVDVGLEQSAIATDTIGLDYGISTRSFRDLYKALSDQIAESLQTTDIVSLFAFCTKLKSSGRKSLLSSIESWIETEVSQGTLSEKDVRHLLRAVVSLGDTKPARPKVPWTVCLRIWNGIKTSKVRSISDFGDQTTALLLRAVSQNPTEAFGLSDSTEILISLASAHPDRAASLLLHYARMLLDNRSAAFPVTLDAGRPSGRYQVLMDLLQKFPPDVFSEVIVKAVSTLIREFKASYGPEADKRCEWLRLLLSALSRKSLLRTARQTKRWDSAWQQIERNLSTMSAKILACYLRAFNDNEICGFIIKYLVCTWRAPTLSPDQSSNISEEFPNSWKVAMHALPVNTVYGSAPYVELLNSVNSACHHLTDRLLRLLLPLLYHLERPEQALAVVQQCYSGHLHKRGLPLEQLFHEVARWTEHDPVSALRLLLMDKRPAAGLCPSLPRALERANKCPTDTLLKLVAQLSRTYGRRQAPRPLPWTSTRYDITKHSSGLLHLVATRVASQSDIKPAIAVRRVQRILMLFRDAPESLRQDMAVALTRAGIIKSLGARRKVPDGRMQWIGSWVNNLEGPQVWKEVQGKAAVWWRQIEREEACAERVWRPGIGWVSRVECIKSDEHQRA